SEVGSTTFNAFSDGTWLYFSFKVDDTDIVTSNEFQVELDVTKGDRVELFFARDTTLANYYCVEVNPHGKILDYRASYYRDFDDGWDLNDLSVYAALTETGYLVEGKLPVSFLDSVGTVETTGDLKLWLGI